MQHMKEILCPSGFSVLRKTFRRKHGETDQVIVLQTVKSSSVGVLRFSIYDYVCTETIFRHFMQASNAVYDPTCCLWQRNLVAEYGSGRGVIEVSEEASLRAAMNEVERVLRQAVVPDLDKVQSSSDVFGALEIHPKWSPAKREVIVRVKKDWLAAS